MELFIVADNTLVSATGGPLKKKQEPALFPALLLLC